MAEAIFEVFRGNRDGGQLATYRVPIAPGMVVLDALHHIQAHQAPDLAVRWNCKAAKCGSCSAEVNGRPRLTCKTRVDSLPMDQPIVVMPMKSFPRIKDLVTDVSWNYTVNKKIYRFIWPVCAGNNSLIRMRATTGFTSKISARDRTDSSRRFSSRTSTPRSPAGAKNGLMASWTSGRGHSKPPIARLAWNSHHLPSYRWDFCSWPCTSLHRI